MPPSTPKLPEKFTFGTELALEETRTLELKEVKGANPAGAIANAADEYAVAFLNSAGGTILWGVRDSDHAVIGVSIPPDQRDRLRQTVVNKLHLIRPEIDPTRFRFELHPVEGAAPERHLVIVELSVPLASQPEPFYTSSHEMYVRVDGANKRLSGPQLTDWIKHRHGAAEGIGSSIDEPKLTELVQRIRRIFSAHGLEPAHWTRFLRIRRAPFTIALTDIQTDRALLAWLDEDKISWIADTFLVQRSWIDGESSEIHERFYYHKQPAKFFQTVSQHVDTFIWEDALDLPSAYFIRWGREEEWATRGGCRVFVVTRIPLVKLSDERYVYKYISDFEPYPWNHPVTNIQLRAWARLLFVNKSISCLGCDISFKDGNSLFNNSVFLHEAIESRATIRTHIWHPEDHALYPGESIVAKDTDSLPAVISFLRDHKLPFEETSLTKKLS